VSQHDVHYELERRT